MIQAQTFFRIPEEKKFLAGCNRCHFGRIQLISNEDAQKRYPQAYTLPDLLLFMFRDGLFTFCDCDAGQVAAQVLEKAAADARTRAAALLFRAAALVQPADEPEDDEPNAIDVDPEEVGEEEGHRRALGYIVAVSGHEEADSHMVGLTAAGTLEWGGRSPHVKVGEA
jgi:hypothetical protein